MPRPRALVLTLTPLLILAPLGVGALLLVLGAETASPRPAALAAIIIGGTAPYNWKLLVELRRTG